MDESATANRADIERKQRLAWDPATSDEVRIELMRDPNPQVRAAAAQEASPEQLRALAGDKRAEVRAAVAANPNTPVDVAEQLVLDRSANVRFWLTRTEHKQILKALAGDKDRLVASTAKSQLNCRRLHRRMLGAPGEAIAKAMFRRSEKMGDDE